MALRTPPVPITQASARGMTARARIEEFRIEQRVHDAEIAAFCERMRPLLRRAEYLARSTGPASWQVTHAMTVLVEQLAARWTDGEVA